MLEWLWPDSSEATWPTDRGLAYGDGVFETLRMLPSGPVLAEQHRDRLLAGCRALGLPFTRSDWDLWWRGLEHRRWLSAGQASGHIIKIVITRGSGGRGYRPPPQATPRVITTRAAMPALPVGPVRLQLCRTHLASPQLEGLKTLNRLEQVIASRELMPGCFEGLMTDPQGRPVEGTRSNIFVLSEGVVYTPPKWQLAVAGVLRNVLIERLPEIGIPVRERPLSFAWLGQSQGVFIANSVMGVVIVGQVGCCRLSLSETTASIQSFTRQHFGI